MAKINVVLTDTDELYLNRLTNYLIQNADSFNISSFTSKEILNEFLANKANKVDILIIPEQFINESIESIDIPAKIILSEGSSNRKIEGFEYINKYQKADKFVSDILLIFAEKTGRIGAITKGDKNTKIIGLYSPVGGSGKTTIALALSALCASLGLTVLYLNFERINSATAFFAEAPSGNMSDIFLALKTKGANLGLKIISNRYADPVSKIHYINSPESAMEYNELSEKEVANLLREIDTLAEYNIVFVDMQSSFDTYTLNLLLGCDQIVVPFSQDALSLAKMNAFLNETRFHENLSNLVSKSHLVANKVVANGAETIQASQIVQHKAVAAYIPYSPILADIKNLSYAGNINQTALVSIYNLIMQE